MIRLFIEPTDVLVFRTGLPFDAGQDSYAAGMFPPSPEPLQGALRTVLAHALAGNQSFSETFATHAATLGDETQPGRFRMRGPFLARPDPTHPGKIERLYPPPADLYSDKNGVTRRLQPIELTEQSDVLTSWPDNTALRSFASGSTSKENRPFKHWLTNTELLAWQRGDADSIEDITGVDPGELWTYEPRIGIKQNSTTRVVDEGFLYRLEFVRLQPGVGLDIDIWLEGDGEIDEADLKQITAGATARLGGEGRSVRLHPLPPIADPVPTAGERSRLYLATPAVLADGWQPAGSDWSTLTKAAPIAVAIERYQPLGGWRMRIDPSRSTPLPLSDNGGGHKVLVRSIPAGSVYFFDTQIGWTATSRFTDDDQKRKIGYGLAVEGRW
jgi:CRISPR-associated protein Cmr3